MAESEDEMNEKVKVALRIAVLLLTTWPAVIAWVAMGCSATLYCKRPSGWIWHPILKGWHETNEIFWQTPAWALFWDREDEKPTP